MGIEAVSEVARLLPPCDPPGPQMRLDRVRALEYHGWMKTPPPTWDTMSLDDRNAVVLSQLVSGASPMDLADRHGTTAIDVVMHLGSAEFRLFFEAMRPVIARAERLVASSLQYAQVLTARSGRGGFAVDELKALTSIYGANDAVAAVNTDKTAAAQIALQKLTAQRWKFGQQPTPES